MKQSILFSAFVFFNFYCHGQQWELSIDTPDIQMGRDGIETFDGNYVVTSNAGGNISGGLTLLLDTSGNILRQLTMGGFCIRQTPDSGFILACDTPGVFGIDGALAKLNSDLTISWTKHYGILQGQQGFRDVEVTADSGFIACGINDDGSSNQMWLVKTNAMGDTIWTKSFGGVFTDFADEVEQTNDGGYIVIGRQDTHPTEGLPILYIVKTFENGEMEWEHNYSDYEYGISIEQVADGGYIALVQGALIKLDSSGTIEWETIISPEVGFYSVVETDDYGYVAAGYKIIDTQTDDRDIYLQKFCPSGAVSWSQTFSPSAYYDAAESVYQTTDGNFLMCGYSFFGIGGIGPYMHIIKTNEEEADCEDTCSANFTLYPDTIPLHYIAVNSASGIEPLQYVWSWGDGSVDSIAYPTHVYDTSGTYTVCLSITSITGCTDTFCIEQVFKTDQEMRYITVVSPLTSDVPVYDLKPLAISLYPNPAHDIFTIETEMSQGTYQLFDITGKTLLQGTASSPKFTLDISTLSSGVYFISVTDGERQVNGKVVKE
ncbi:MAG: hypothetical protein POELPBGB_00556 [Bacteroidia bacterium]|nr:hypothetical protein [Bacteroidia bacterium]